MYSDAKETQTKPLGYKGYKLKLHYNKKIQCNEGETYKELSSSWKAINEMFMKESNAARGDKRLIYQGKIWGKFLDCHFIEFPNVSQFAQITLASLENTSLLERDYTHLQMIASKRRNQIEPENLETLFYLLH